MLAIRALTFLVVLVVASAPGLAQRAPATGNEVPQGSPIPRIVPPVLPGVQPGIALPPAATAAPTADVAHALRQVTVDGVTAYPPATIATITAGLTGPAVSQARIEAARVAIVNRYRGDGYVFTAVSAFINGEQLRFVVTEGHVTDVRLDGDIGPAGAQVLRFLNHVIGTGPTRSDTLERWLLLASDIPGVTIRSVLQPSSTEPGGLLLVAQVSRAAVGGLLTADNRAFRQTGPEEGLAVLDLNSVTPFGERTELSLYHTFDGTQTFGQLSTEFFVGGSGLRVKIYGGAGETTPSGLFRSFGYDGTTNIFGAQISYPLIRQRQQTLNLFGNLDALESEVRANTPQDNATTRLSFDSLRVLRVGANYARSDLLLGDDRQAVNAGLVRLSQGLPILGASGNDAPDAPRASERTDFTKIDAEISRVQTLYHPWNDADVALVGIIAGQYSPDVLPPAEQYFLGGSRFNRGYYSGQVTGDRALVGTLELQLNTPVLLPKFVPTGIEASAQFYTFYDFGTTWQSHSEDANHTLNSVGTGVRLFVTRYTEFDVEAVLRLTRYPDGTGNNVSAVNGEALFWRVLTRF